MRTSFIIWALITCVLSFTGGYEYGSTHQKLLLEKSNIILIQQQNKKYNKVLAERESQILELSNTNTKLLTRVKQDAEIINRTNHITNRFVRYSSVNSVPEATTAVIESSEASDDDERVYEPSRIVKYNILLMEAYNQCRINYNALIDSVK